MLRGQLIHPQMLEAIGSAGHGSQVLITDGHFPASTKLGPNATLVPLNLSPGIVSATQVLEAVAASVAIEAAAVMGYARTGPYALKEDPPIWADFKRILSDAGYTGELEEKERFDFYDAAAHADTALTVLTADQRIYANLLLTIGVTKPG